MFDMIFDYQHDEPPILFEDKTKIRAEIQQAVDDYIRNGGTIEVLESFESAYDAISNRPKVLSDRQRHKIKSLKKGSLNGNAERMKKSKGRLNG